MNFKGTMVSFDVSYSTMFWVVICSLVLFVFSILGYLIAHFSWKKKYNRLSYYYETLKNEKIELQEKTSQLTNKNLELNKEIESLENLIAETNQREALLEVEIDKLTQKLTKSTKPAKTNEQENKKKGGFRKAIGSVFKRFNKAENAQSEGEIEDKTENVEE